MTDEAWRQLILMHGKRLRRISVHRMPISLDAIRSICVQCTELEQLFLVVDPELLVRNIYFSSPFFWACWGNQYSKKKCFMCRTKWGLVYPLQRHLRQYTSTIQLQSGVFSFLRISNYPFSISAVRRLPALDVTLKYGRLVQLDKTWWNTVEGLMHCIV